MASVGRQTLNVKKVDEGTGPFLAFLTMWKDLLMCPLQSILLQEGGEEHTICTKLRFLKLLLYYTLFRNLRFVLDEMFQQNTSNICHTFRIPYLDINQDIH